ncbi:MAG: YHS domain-containing protein, partial [Woeseiaceae bacterium]|nr:YHS domain-containing protein [Woeseiaceae bacterium]
MTEHSHHQEAHGGRPDSASATDPVCGMQVKKDSDKRTSDYGGETWYFCGKGCQARFDADPYFYASGNAKKAQQV